MGAEPLYLTSPPDRRLTPLQMLVANSLADGLTPTAAGAANRVSLRAVKRWLLMGRFRAAVRTLRDEATGRAVNRLSRSMCDAGDVLHGLLQSPSEGVRLDAARAIVELGCRVHEAFGGPQLQPAPLKGEGKPANGHPPANGHTRLNTLTPTEER